MNPSNTSLSRARLLGIVAVVALLVIALVAYAKLGHSTSTASTTPSPTVAEATPTPVASVADSGTPATASSYKDGSYSAVGQYRSPGGQQRLNVSLTVKDGTVTAAQVSEGAQDPESRSYQEMFIGGYQAQVVGHALDSLQLSRVSGSSLTPQGFNDAVAQIKTQAKA